jgi:predicted nucleic acid-binding protein
VIVLDTSVLVESLGAGGSLRDEFRRAIALGHRLLVPTLVLYEWLRGPRVDSELAVQEAVLPSAEALPFGNEEARTAAELYRALPRPRGREVDLAIAACTIAWDASLWTLNPGDFIDVPGLRLHG